MEKKHLYAYSKNYVQHCIMHCIIVIIVKYDFCSLENHRTQKNITSLRDLFVQNFRRMRFVWLQIREKYMSVFWFSGRPVQCSKGKTRITKWSPIVTQLMGSTVMIPCAVTDNAYRQYWKDNFGNVIDTELDPRRKVRKLLARLSKLLHCCQLLIFSSTLKFFENQ